jgi:hypothetical protein
MRKTRTYTTDTVIAVYAKKSVCAFAGHKEWVKEGITRQKHIVLKGMSTLKKIHTLILKVAAGAELALKLMLRFKMLSVMGLL